MTLFYAKVNEVVNLRSYKVIIYALTVDFITYISVREGKDISIKPYENGILPTTNTMLFVAENGSNRSLSSLSTEYNDFERISRLRSFRFLTFSWFVFDRNDIVKGKKLKIIACICINFINFNINFT